MMPSLDAEQSHLCCRNWCNPRQPVAYRWRLPAPIGWPRRRKQAGRDAGSARTKATPKALLAVARRAEIHLHAWLGNSAAWWHAGQAMLDIVGNVQAFHLYADMK